MGMGVLLQTIFFPAVCSAVGVRVGICRLDWRHFKGFDELVGGGRT
jgi:hypothetical protein